MVDENSARRYQLRQRADAMEEVRQRITDAAIELHGTVGPARTTIAGIAALAKVQRHTVYRHFPTGDDLFTACSSRYWTRHPWPDLRVWRRIRSADDRLLTALKSLYEHYRTVEPMLSNVLHDAATMPVVARSLESYGSYLNEVAEVLAQPYESGDPQNPLLLAAIRHVISFSTWRSLVGQGGLCPTEAIRLCATVVKTAATLAGEPTTAVSERA